jgi:hypothetical protein
MYSFQNATNEMKAWLPNDSLQIPNGFMVSGRDGIFNQEYH